MYSIRKLMRTFAMHMMMSRDSWTAEFEKKLA